MDAAAVHTTLPPLLHIHRNGAFMGAAVAGLIAVDRSPALPLAVATFVMLGCIWMVVMIPGTPFLFATVDICGCLPAGYFGWLIATQLRK
jgi:hypothetical protein